MNVNLYGLEANSYVDGPGIRMGIFFQGCLRHCKGCHNKNSWDVAGGISMDVEELKRRMLADALLDGVTFSGGEPFLQPAALTELAAFAQSVGLNVWCYSGYTFEELYSSNEKDSLKYIDVLVDGPFVEEKKSLDLTWRGSRNQRIIDVRKSLRKGKVVLYDRK